jgi:hypothetical protein
MRSTSRVKGPRVPGCGAVGLLRGVASVPLGARRDPRSKVAAIDATAGRPAQEATGGITPGFEPEAGAPVCLLGQEPSPHRSSRTDAARLMRQSSHNPDVIFMFVVWEAGMLPPWLAPP